MGMQENMADMLRTTKQSSGKSIASLSEEWDIAQSTLQEYLRGDGNPTIKMVEHLANKLGIDPVALVAGQIEAEQYETILLMLNTIKAVSSLAPPKRVRFAELFLEQMQLWSQEL